MKAFGAPAPASFRRRCSVRSEVDSARARSRVESGRVAGLADDSLRLDDEGVQSREIALGAVDRGLGPRVAQKHGVRGDARDLPAAKPADGVQGEVHPGERWPCGGDASVLDERRAACDVGAGIAPLELIEPARGGCAAPAVEKASLAEEEVPEPAPQMSAPRACGRAATRLRRRARRAAAADRSRQDENPAGEWRRRR